MTGHAARDGMDGVVDIDAARGEQIGELAQRGLRLRDREAVARHEDDLVGVAEHDRDVVGTSRAHWALFPRAATTLGRAREGTEEGRGERAPHGLGHLPSEQRARRTDERARDDEEDVAQDIARCGDGQAREGIEQ